jgi:hypothetical protein
MRGVSRSSRTRDGMRWTLMARLTRALICGRRSRVVLTPRRWRQVGERNFTGDGGKKARSPGRARRKPLKPLRREGRVFRRPVVTNARAIYSTRAAAGATGTRLSLRPPIFEGGNSCTTRAHRAAGMLSVVIARESGAIQYSEASVIEPKSCGVLDTPLARSMTASCEARLLVNSNRKHHRLKIMPSTSSRCCQR